MDVADTTWNNVLTPRTWSSRMTTHANQLVRTVKYAEDSLKIYSEFCARTDLFKDNNVDGGFLVLIAVRFSYPYTHSDYAYNLRQCSNKGLVVCLNRADTCLKLIPSVNVFDAADLQALSIDYFVLRNVAESSPDGHLFLPQL